MPDVDSVLYQPAGDPKNLEYAGCAAVLQTAPRVLASCRQVEALSARGRAGGTPMLPGKPLRVERWARLTATCAVFAWSLLSGGGTLASETNIVKIGLLLPPEEPQALSVREGVLLASEQANNTGSTPLEVIIRGRTGQWGADGVEAARMVIDDAVEALIAPPDGAASHLTLQVSGRTAVPVITLCADSSVGRTGVPWMLRIVPRTADEAKALFTGISAKASNRTNRWVALVPGGRAGREISRDLTQAALGYGIHFAGVVEFAATAISPTFIRSRVLSSGPDVVLVWLDPLAAGKALKHIKAAGFGGILAGPGWLQCPDFLNAAGDALNGFIVPAVLRTDEGTARWQSFHTSYHQRWGHQPAMMSAMSYDAAMLLNYLLRQPEFQSPPHRLTPGFSRPGVTGELAFDPEGNRAVKLQLLCFHNGRFIPAIK